MSTDTPIPTPATIPHVRRRYRVGDAVLMGGEAHAVVATDLGGVTIETLDRTRAQVYVHARDMDNCLTPAP